MLVLRPLLVCLSFVVVVVVVFVCLFSFPGIPCLNSLPLPVAERGRGACACPGEFPFSPTGAPSPDASLARPRRHRPPAISQNHRMFGVGRDLCGSSGPTPLPKQGHLQQAAEHLVQAGLEHLQRRRLHNLPGQPVSVLRHPQGEEVLPHGRFCRSVLRESRGTPRVGKSRLRQGAGGRER